MNWSETCVERTPATNVDIHDRMVQGMMAGSVLTFVVCGAFLSLNVILRCKRFAVSDRLRQCYSFGTFEHDVALSIICALQQIVFWMGSAKNFWVYDNDIPFCRTQAIATQLLFIAEIMEVAVIFFYGERLLVATVPVAEIRQRYLACSFSLIAVVSVTFTLAPLLMELLAVPTVHVFGGVAEGAFCWVSCSQADWVFIYAVAIPVSAYSIYAICRQLCAVCKLQRRGSLDHSSKVMVYLYKRVGFMVMLILTILVSATYTLYSTDTLHHNGTTDDDTFSVAYWTVLRLHGAIAIAPLLVPDTLCSGGACRRRKVSIGSTNSPRLSFMEHRGQAFSAEFDDEPRGGYHRQSFSATHDGLSEYGDDNDGHSI